METDASQPDPARVSAIRIQRPEHGGVESVSIEGNAFASAEEQDGWPRHQTGVEVKVAEPRTARLVVANNKIQNADGFAGYSAHDR